MTYISNSEKCKRITKYILMGLVTTCSLRYIPNTLLTTRELIMISFISSISFAILDMTSPSMVIDSSSKPDSQKIAIVHNLMRVKKFTQAIINCHKLIKLYPDVSYLYNLFG